MESVKLIECPRDAWQGLKNIIPTEQKVDYLRGLIVAGFRHLDSVSFVSPRAVPQMADSEEVLEQLGHHEGIEIIGIVVNEKGAERAIATGKVTTLGFPYSLSETFLRRNQNQSRQENEEILRRVMEQARQAGLSVVVYISMAFGNPYGEAWNEEAVISAVERLRTFDIPAVSLADTVGAADPKLIQRVVGSAIPRSSSIELGVHLHSTRAGATEKILAAYDAGCRRFDSALGGLGGCPFAQNDLVGNIPTEEVLRALEQQGVPSPLGSLSAVSALNERIAATAHQV